MNEFSFPTGWDKTTLSQIALIEMGQSPDSRSYNREGKGLPFFQGKAEFQAIFPEIKKWCTEPTKIVNRGDILLSIRAPVGPTNIAAQQSCIGRGLAGVRAEKGISQSYLFYYFRNIEPWLSQQGTGSTFAAISGQFVKEISIPIAPSNEQSRIVNRLEELLTDLDAGVSELKTAQKKLAQYRQSLLKAAVEGALTAQWREDNPATENGAQLLERILQERRARWEAKQLAKFAAQGKKPPKEWQKKYPEPVQPDTTDLPQLPEGWVWASVEQIASDEQYSLAIGPFGSNLKVSDYRDSGVPLVFVRNIRSGNYGGENTRFVSQEKAKELSAHGVMPGDVVVTKMGEPPGDADVYPDDQPPAIITADCIKIRCFGELMSPFFLKIAINSNVGKRQIEPMTQGVAQKKVSLGRFSKLAIPVPPENEQSLIVQMVGEADNDAFAQLAAIDLSLKQCSAQRQNILRAAFAGQLVSQDPSDEPASVLLERIRVQRAEQAKQPKPRKTKKKESSAVARKLVDVLTEAGDWLPAQEAFRRCGITDGAQTEEIEALYAELRVLDKSQRLLVEAITELVVTPEGERKQRKIADRLKMVG
ncbi:restriction endonuclease subunit S [Aeromonas caviae]|uniref:restriction endonuclease subunit S n=1 Tax=Aeromonas caviae TaxID=648 RepID=UPI0029D73FA8|nr:restriction endonuclease subunit S [Aeromonas caviae]MDX7706524.1 restriction endonuclease subunit S [Aeromonas caviae]MDX7796823.1 restriction endonuclease subunit S [Aeromonas caviae]